MKEKEITKRKPTFLEAFSVLVVLIVLLVFVVSKGLDVIPPLAITCAYMMFIGARCGYTWGKLIEAVLDRCRGLVEVLFIIYAIGAFIGAMMYSGTIPTLIYYLVELISPKFIVVLSFLICGAVAILIGTSWGTIGTVGVIMISIATSLGVPLAPVAAAIATGSHLGQTMSPMSDMANLSGNLSGSDTMTMIKRMAYFGVPVVVVSIIVYSAIGFMSGSGVASMEAVELIKKETSTVYNVNPVVILPMLMVFFMTFRKQPVIKSLFLASMVAIPVGVIFHGFDLALGINVLRSGFDLTTITGLNAADFSDIFVNLVNRGGAMSMSSAVLLTLVATFMGAIMVKVGIVNVIVESVFKNVKGRVGLTVSVVLVTVMMVACTSSSVLAIMLAIEFFREKFHAAGMDDKDLTSTAMSVGSQFIAVVPWCDTAVYIAGITGVTTMAYAPYAFFCWASSVVAIVLSIFGIGYAKSKKTEK